MSTCPTCDGKKVLPCPRCKGDGRESAGFGGTQKCSHCTGTGTMPCNNCNGHRESVSFASHGTRATNIILIDDSGQALT